MSQNNIASLIFPAIPPNPRIFGASRPRSDIVLQIRRESASFSTFLALSSSEQNIFLEFCMGNRGLRVTCDPFFQHLFHPAIHPGRLNRMLSCILKQKIKVRTVFPGTPTRSSSSHKAQIFENNSLVMMDILAELSDGTPVSVEIQRMGYEFPLERSFFYGADLLIRQSCPAIKEKKFPPRGLNPVYIIVLMDKNPELFRKQPNQYIHRSRYSLDSGLRLKSPENYIYISLDNFRNMPHKKLTELDAWLYFLSGDSPNDMRLATQKYPFFRIFCEDIIRFRYRPEKLLKMYSEALKRMNPDTIKYQMDEMQTLLQNKDRELSQKNSLINTLRERLALLENATSTSPPRPL